MSRKEVEESKHITTPAKKVDYQRGKTTFLDGVKVSKVKEDAQPAEFLYAIGGVLTEDQTRSMAKKVVSDNGHTDFYVKVATAGVSCGRMLNPWGPSYNIGDELRYEKQMGRYRYEFRKVSEFVFNLYMKFLETRNERYLLNAERECNGQQ